ncbi:ABC transporter ATP-binding protein [Thioalkalivibrio paradoxus]|uniref:ABC transporter ATP-binding protein n=1 Tax=Thioalkalivibrio paradoxus TaxID=108010 RepID=UPI000307305C|nr:polysaccharide ABC transporter ATP-binding protein [Thioalkalivibrio paradoxus]
MSTTDATRSTSIRLRGVGKTYAVYAQPVDRLLELVSRRKRHQEFTALAPLDLDVYTGESLGIVGSNGAGKSTLMHLLVGSHQPSSGEMEIHGTVLGLLELGVGFHPEFSGLQNIFFYADTLGLDRRFVRARIPEIIAFSEIGGFIDQPLRTYSTGMKVRLAFALVASLDPDILIVDEALAVGDLHFQKKCIDRMTAFRRANKTIVFCSHSRYQIEQFCDRVLWLDQGRVRMLGTPADVMARYEAEQLALSDDDRLGTGNRAQTRVRIDEFTLLTPQPMSEGDDLVVRWSTDTDPDVRYHVSVSLKLDSGRGLAVVGTQFRGDAPCQGPQQGTLAFPSVPLLGGIYSLQLRVWDDEALIEIDERYIDNVVVRRSDAQLGIMRLPYHWRVEPGKSGAPVPPAAPSPNE